MTVKIKQFELEYIEDNPPIVDDIPGITDLALDYSSSIGGANAPEEGADVTSDNPQAASWLTDGGALATKDQVDTAEIVDGAVEKVKMALLSVDADIIAASAITESKLYTGAVTVDKIGANAVTAAKIAANTITASEIAASTITATEMNVSTLSAISANIGSITAGTITGVTITGGTIRTSSSGARVQMSTSDYLQIYDNSRERMRLDEDTLYFYNPSGTTIGKVYSDSSNMWLERPDTGGYLVIKTGSTSTYGIALYNGTTAIALINSDGIIMQNNKPIYNSGAYGSSVGISSRPFGAMYATTYYFAKSGATTKYIQLNASSGIDCNANFYVGGTLSKAAGSFRIDHPLKKDYWLQHSFVESPEMLNIYTGQGIIENGYCKITMPDWFIALNGTDFSNYTYQLTPFRQNRLCVAREMNELGEVLFAGTEDGKFYYMITAVRHDKYALENRIEIELKK